MDLTRARSALIISGSCLFLAIALYAASPFVALWSVASALQAGDVGSVRDELDWRNVRVGLKTELAPAQATEDELPGFGDSFATKIVANVVDDMVTPDHLVSVLAHMGSRAAPRAGTASTASAVGSGLALLTRVSHVGFASPCGFEAAFRLGNDRQMPPVTVALRIEKWRWKITAIHIPDQMLSSGESRT